MDFPREVRDWFTSGKTYTQQMEERKKLVPVDTVIGDAWTDCDECAGTGCCEGCGGDSYIEHYCDCSFCDETEERCGRCDGTGKCDL